MKRLLVLVIGFCAACDQSDNVGSECQDTQIQCTLDMHCANAPGSTCSPNGVCMLCSTDMPDAAANPPDAPACTNPPNQVQCGPNTNACSNYPGTICGPAGQCVCPTPPPPPTCTQPPTGLACMNDTSCGNYPGSVCGPQGFCICP